MCESVRMEIDRYWMRCVCARETANRKRGRQRQRHMRRAKVMQRRVDAIFIREYGRSFAGWADAVLNDRPAR